MKNTWITVIVMVSVACIGSAVFGNDRLRNSCFGTGTMTAQMSGGMMDKGGMREMMQRMMPDMLPPGIKPEDLPAPESPGARLVALYCAQCHNLPTPAMHSAEEWPRIADRMFHRMSMSSGEMGMMSVESPSTDEQQTIVAYLKKFALKSISPEAVPSGETSGSALFKTTCSQCHALPDPKMHTADEWPKIVERMQSHMVAMGKAAIKENEKKDIVNYLTRNARQ